MQRTVTHATLALASLLIITVGAGASERSRGAELPTSDLPGIPSEIDWQVSLPMVPAAPAEAESSPTSAFCAVFPGDGAGSGPELSYTDNGDGTVTDNNTGCMWEIKVAGGGSCLTDLHAVDAWCDWADATGAWIAALNAEGPTGYAGYSDWRLPNVKQLQSIVDFGEYAPAIDPAFAGETASTYHWSATSVISGPTKAWIVEFLYGFVDSVSKANGYRVRAVRGCP